MQGAEEFSRLRYEQASAKYRPERTRVLFVAEAPPSSLDRYFYFEDVGRQDSLWVELMKELLGMSGGPNTRIERRRKPKWLRRFQEGGYFLIDAVKEPMDCSDPARIQRIKKCRNELIAEIRQINPAWIVLIKGTVYKALFPALRAERLPVIDCKLPFPGNGQQRKFHEGFPRAILSADR